MVTTAATEQRRTPADFVYREAIEAARMALLPPEPEAPTEKDNAA